MIPVNEIFERFPEIKDFFYKQLFAELEEGRKAIEADVRRSYEYRDALTIETLMNSLTYNPYCMKYEISDRTIAGNRELMDLFHMKIIKEAVREDNG